MRIEQFKHKFEPVTIVIQSTKELELFTQMVRCATNHTLDESELEEFTLEVERLLECPDDEQ